MSRFTRIGITLAAVAALVAVEAQACTRVIYHGPNGTYLTGRSMDFKAKIPWSVTCGFFRVACSGTVLLGRGRCNGLPLMAA